MVLILFRIPKRFQMLYVRFMSDNYKNWATKRNTGMRVSWHYSPAPGPNVKPYTGYTAQKTNKAFIHLANVINEHNGVPQDLQELMKDIRADKLINEEPQCTLGKNKTKTWYEKNYDLISSKYKDTSKAPIYKNEITEDVLDTAAELWLTVMLCTDLTKESLPKTSCLT